MKPSQSPYLAILALLGPLLLAIGYSVPWFISSSGASLGDYNYGITFLTIIFISISLLFFNFSIDRIELDLAWKLSIIGLLIIIGVNVYIDSFTRVAVSRLCGSGFTLNLGSIITAIATSCQFIYLGKTLQLKVDGSSNGYLSIYKVILWLAIVVAIYYSYVYVSSGQECIHFLNSR